MPFMIGRRHAPATNAPEATAAVFLASLAVFLVTSAKSMISLAVLTAYAEEDTLDVAKAADAAAHAIFPTLRIIFFLLDVHLAGKCSALEEEDEKEFKSTCVVLVKVERIL